MQNARVRKQTARKTRSLRIARHAPRVASRPWALRPGLRQRRPENDAVHDGGGGIRCEERPVAAGGDQAADERRDGGAQVHRPVNQAICARAIFGKHDVGDRRGHDGSIHLVKQAGDHCRDGYLRRPGNETEHEHARPAAHQRRHERRPPADAIRQRTAERTAADRAEAVRRDNGACLRRRQAMHLRQIDRQKDQDESADAVDEAYRRTTPRTGGASRESPVPGDGQVRAAARGILNAKRDNANTRRLPSRARRGPAGGAAATSLDSETHKIYLGELPAAGALGGAERPVANRTRST